MHLHAQIDWPGSDATDMTIPIGGQVRVGRSTRCGFRLPHPTVSREHAELRVAQGVLEVRDLGSTSGTHIADRAIGEAWTQVALGDKLWFGTWR